MSPTVFEMMQELDEIAAQHGIKWSGAEVASYGTAERTRYAQPGQKCGRGFVRQLSDRQVAYIKRLMAERDTTNLVRLPGSEDIEHMSLRGASDLIDRLLGCPELPAEKRQEPRATEKQQAYIRSLAERKGIPLEGAKALESFTKKEATELIDNLLKMADAPREQAKSTGTGLAFPDVPAGHFAVEYDGQLRFYKVDKPTEGRWAGWTFLKEQASDDYYPVKNKERKSEILTLIALDPWSAGKRYGIEIGRCWMCHRTLTDETSRALGIGPDCRSKK